MLKKSLFLLFIISTFSLNAQVAMGKWRIHFAYNSVSQITQSENKVYALSEGALFSVDKRDNSTEFYSKISGLNGNNISRVKFDPTSKSLLIVYNNGNIDYLTEDGIINMPDYYNKQMSADKNINHILFYNNKAFLSANFGVIVLNMIKKEIQDTYYIGAEASEVKVLGTAILNDKLYAISSDKIYFANVNDPNLINFERWSTMPDLPGNGDLQSIETSSGSLVLMRGGFLYKYMNDTWAVLDESITYKNITASNNYLFAFTNDKSYYFDSNFNKIEMNISFIKDAIVENDNFWLAADTKGIIKYNKTGETLAVIKPDGPAVNIPFRMRFSGQKLFVVQGGRWASQEGKQGLVMIYENNIWKNILSNEIPTGYPVLDFMNIAVDPKDDKHFFIPSYGTGVFEFKEDKFVSWHNFSNSTLETIFPNHLSDRYDYMRTDGGVYDKDGNIWFTNSSVSTALKVLKKDGSWTKVSLPELDRKGTIGEIIISNQNKNQKWVLNVRVEPGIGVIDDNGTLEDANDDKKVFLYNFVDTEKGGYFSPTYCYTLAQDNNGSVWVGTDKGPIIFNNPSKAFDPGFTFTRVKIPRNDGTDLADFLLENEQIKAIAIDGANRKWIGTASSGVYLTSENGQQIIKHFTETNSPLLSDNILSIVINPVSGEVFFGTGNGIISYQSDAAEGYDTFTNVHAYPNPVRPDYSGLITITGLVDKAHVKITDISGNLITETISNGSIATWDGKNKYGQKVSTGVYLALCVTEDGTQSTTTKIMIIN